MTIGGDSKGHHLGCKKERGGKSGPEKVDGAELENQQRPDKKPKTLRLFRKWMGGGTASKEGKKAKEKYDPIVARQRGKGLGKTLIVRT